MLTSNYVLGKMMSHEENATMRVKRESYILLSELAQDAKPVMRTPKKKGTKETSTNHLRKWLHVSRISFLNIMSY